MEVMNFVFMMIYTIELALKIIALKTAYFNDSWNVFDFFIVVSTLSVQILVTLNFPISVASSANILRVLRIGRILRLIKRMKGL
jgi:hypothetical protein